jgi:hypothetical protein
MLQVGLVDLVDLQIQRDLLRDLIPLREKFKKDFGKVKENLG